MAETKNKKPNLFIVGAAKSGTTSLFRYLNHHPKVYFSPIKEPNFFSTDIKVEEFNSTYKKNTFLENDRYFAQKFFEPLQLAFVRDMNQYNSLFNGVENQQIIGEASTSYLYSTDAAQNIFKFNPKAKIIIILRNPVERAFSHYLMALRYGFTNLDFRRALEKDMADAEKGWGKTELFIELGMYFEQLKRYFELFPSSQIQVFLFDHLKNEPQKLVDDCFSFLEIESVKMDSFKEHNKALVPGNKKLNTFMVNTGLKNLLIKIVSDKTKGKLKKLFFNNELPELHITDKAFLLDIYKHDILQTSKLLAVDLSNWLK